MLVLILSACVILSHQQFVPDYGQRALFWIPYLLPTYVINHYRPVYYDYPEDDVFHDSQTFTKPLEQSKVTKFQFIIPNYWLKNTSIYIRNVSVEWKVATITRAAMGRMER